MAPLPRLLPATTAPALPFSRPPRASELFCRRLSSPGRAAVIPGARIATGFAFSSRNCSPRQRKIPLHVRDPVGKLRCIQPKVQDEADYETCELVNGTELIIEEGENSIRAYLMKAVKNNNGSGVLLLSDIFGFEDSSTREFAYRVACSGYNVLVPDLFQGNPWKSGRAKADFEPWLACHPREQVAADIATSVRWLEEEFIAAGISKKLGIIGFCFSGRHLIETLAADEPGWFGAGVCFYGTSMDPGLAKKVKAPVLFICGDDDPQCPPSVAREMEKSIHGAKAVVYPGRGHGFAHRPASQEEDDDAEDAFAAARTWLHDLLV